MYPSIFNDVFGPIMIGPSSSAFAGPDRIGQIARDVYGGTPDKFKVSYVPESGRAGLRVGLGTNMGLLSGLLGWDPADERVFTAFDTAKSIGMQTEFIEEVIPDNTNPNAMLLQMSGKNGESISLLADSVGGGTIDIMRIDEYPVTDIKGEEYVLLVFHDHEPGFSEKIKAFLRDKSKYDTNHIIQTKESVSISNNKKILTLIFMEEPVGEPAMLMELQGVEQVKQLNPIMPIVTKKAASNPLFTSVEEMLTLAESENGDCAEIVIRYEMGRSCWTREEVIAYMWKIWNIMKNTIDVGREGNVEHSRGPFHHLYGKSFVDRLQQGKTLVGGIMADAMANSICSHEGKSDNHTLTVAGPAAGAPPIMTGALLSVAKNMNNSDDDIVRALFTAAGIGACTYMRTVPTGEITGCTGEIGVGSAMAAGAVVSMLGGTPKQVGAAASIAIMNLFGLPCDPIAGGGCPMPCRGRSTLAPVNSILCAELALSGFDNVVPYDQVVDSMDSLYKDLPGYMKGSLKAGIPVTPAAKKLESCYQDWVAMNM